jgi:hypothetical protein
VQQWHKAAFRSKRMDAVCENRQGTRIRKDAVSMQPESAQSSPSSLQDILESTVDQDVGQDVKLRLYSTCLYHRLAIIPSIRLRTRKTA